MKTLDAIWWFNNYFCEENWLLVGLFELDLVAMIAGGSTTIFAKIIYIVVGICAIYCLKFFPMITRKVDERY
ncbi:DUF378 domain-containing protein [Enterococcus faecium]|nr:DUF378 domain-containing protein [Enterococcus faecium]